MGYFDGIVHVGRAIDVVAELEALRIEVPDAAVPFSAAIEGIHRQRERRHSGPPALVAPVFLQELVDAGYQPDDPFSLIQALTEANLQVRRTAASALAGFPGNSAVVGALQATARSGEDLVAVRAMESLQTLGTTGWEDTAVARLASMGEGQMGRITLARILAQAGRADGWPAITSALAGDDFLVAVPAVPHFDGLTDRDGRAIDAAAVLRAMYARDPQGERGLLRLVIGPALQQVEEKRAAGPGR